MTAGCSHTHSENFTKSTHSALATLFTPALPIRPHAVVTHRRTPAPLRQCSKVSIFVFSFLSFRANSVPCDGPQQLPRRPAALFFVFVFLAMPRLPLPLPPHILSCLTLVPCSHARSLTRYHLPRFRGHHSLPPLPLSFSLALLTLCPYYFHSHISNTIFFLLSHLTRIQICKPRVLECKIRLYINFLCFVITRLDCFMQQHPGP